LNEYNNEDIFNIIKLYTEDKLSCRKIAKLYNTSHGTISDILKRENVYDYNRRINVKYDENDLNFIKICYENDDWDSIFKKYPNVNKQTIYDIASINKFKHKSTWSDEDITVLKNNIDKLSYEEIAKILHSERTITAIATKASELGMLDNRFWSDKEVQILIQNYSNINIEECMKLLPDRTKNSIELMAHKLNIESYAHKVYWTDYEDDYIRNNWNIMSDIRLSKDLNRTFRSVKWRRGYLGLFRQDKDDKNYEFLSSYLRRNTTKWKNNVINNCNNKCILTGESVFDVHHIYPVNKIIRDILSSHNLYYNDNFDGYTDEQLSLILEEFKIKLENVKGVCLSKPLHKLYHILYRYDNNEEQWNQFVLDYNNHLFDEYLKGDNVLIE
jgi:predicted HTH domain antitoxin